MSEWPPGDDELIAAYEELGNVHKVGVRIKVRTIE